MPNSRFVCIWSFIIGILLIWTAIYLPYRLAFLEDDVPLGFWIMELLIDILFGCDIIINFFIAYYDNENVLVVSKLKIAQRYLKTWFLIDLLSMYIYVYIYIYI